MKSARQALFDYEMALLKAIAQRRGITLTTANRREAVDTLAAALVSPAETAIILADLTGDEQEALQFVLAGGGRIEAPRFTRQYGAIRPMGPARLERERPWQSPVNPAEGLWYRGLIFKTFDLTSQGGVEMVYIPDDLAQSLANCQLPIKKDETPLAFNAGLPAIIKPQPLGINPPASLINSLGRIRENIFSLLVYLRTTPVRLTDKANLSAKDRAGLTDCLLPPLLPHTDPALEVDFLLHLGQRAKLLTVKHGRLRPERDPTRIWLQQTAAEQIRFLQHTWRTDPTWNDLWHVPGLIPQATGWENSPMLGRAKILEHLSTLTPDTWYALDDFVAAIKRLDPDFQRPGGNYDSWYIQDPQGGLLMGFENWERVEGALLRHFLTHLLPWLGMVDLELPVAGGVPAGFRLTAPGHQFLRGLPVAAAAEKALLVRVDPLFYVSTPLEANLYDRFQLARFAHLDRREPERVVYQITQASVGRALRNGVTADQMAAFLARVTNNRTPLKVVETLRTWGSRQDTVKIEPATLLRLKSDTLAVELRQNPALVPLLGEVIGPTTILIPADKVAEVRRILRELGYME